METANDYLRFYQRFAMNFWENLGPWDYGAILICIGVFGWLLMKSSMKI